MYRITKARVNLVMLSGLIISTRRVFSARKSSIDTDVKLGQRSGSYPGTKVSLWHTYTILDWKQRIYKQSWYKYVY